MRDKIFNYGIAIGLIVSILGFIFLKCDLLSGNYSQLIYNLYKITASIAILFILTKSTFVKENFNLIFNYIDEQVNDDVHGQFDEKSDFLDVVKKAIEDIEENN